MAPTGFPWDFAGCSYTHGMLTYRVTDKNQGDAVLAEFQARDQGEAEIIGKDYASGTIFGLWVKQENDDWIEF